MFQKAIFGFCMLFFVGIFAQEKASLYNSKKIVFSKDSIAIQKFSINESFFKILDKNKTEIDPKFYSVNFKKAKILFSKDFVIQDSLEVQFLNYPDFLTKTYTLFDESRVVAKENGNLYVIKPEDKPNVKPFDGLTTSGSITRGITIGNNQNSTLNSNLDLQIVGKLSDKVSLRASIQDSNIPLQNGGYSQKLDEFDQIFIELFADNWNIRAGDLFLENRKSSFLNFNKKVQGLSSRFSFGKPENRTDIFAAGAIVRGQYSKSEFLGQEGNQGPYKLRGKNGELYVLVISGSERVFVNGRLLTRGENNDYVIDYNAGELTFTSIFPITSEMRIVIEYQYSDRSFTRFVTYGGASHESKKWKIGGYLYSESDIKNQPLQQNLAPNQVGILQNAGDDLTLMNAPSAFEDSYSANKILYKKINIGGVDVFQYSNLSTDVLFNVKFTFQGNNLGDYNLANNSAIGKIYQYVAPIGGIKQGQYAPIVQLIAPNKIQIATFQSGYFVKDKTNFDFEIGLSNNDQNLFSSIDDQNNKGIATKFNVKQRLFSKKFTLDAFTNFQFVQQNFKTIERLFTIEFNRDWNLNSISGNQSLLVSGLNFNFKSRGSANYQFEKLDFTDNFSGTKHTFSGNLKHKKFSIQNQSSFLNSSGAILNSTFARSQTLAKLSFSKNWIGLSNRFENNIQKNNQTNLLTNLSQKFSEFGGFIGRGDSTKVFVQLGFLHRNNDSLQSGILKRVNSSNSYYIRSKLIQTKKTNLSLFVNYRRLTFVDNFKPVEPSLNSRLLYNDSFFNQLFQTTTAYENVSGTIAQQEFTYLEVNPGQGVYVWNDYNNNGIQELQEFEVAPFRDLAKYVRVFLPNQIFVKTHQNKFSQSLSINPSQWAINKGFKKALSLFYNQTSFLIDRKIIRNQDNFNLNPFAESQQNLLGLNTNFRNSLFYNRAKQHHSVTYTFLKSKAQNLLSFGTQQNSLQSHQLQYAHLYKASWLFNLNGTLTKNTSFSDTFSARNFELNNQQIEPKISYIFSKNTSFGVFYNYQNKQNQIANSEKLQQQQFGVNFNYSGDQKFTLNTEFSFYNNNFTGNAQTPVAFQMLEGLQPGKNNTWRLLLQKNITKYLDININYLGRSSDSNPTIHTGNVQLRAFF